MENIIVMETDNVFIKLSKVFKNLPAFLEGAQIVEYCFRDWELYVDDVKTDKECKTLALFAFLKNNNPIQTTCVEFYGEWDKDLMYRFKLEIANVGLSEVEEIFTYWNGSKFTLKLKGSIVSPMGDSPFILHSLAHIEKRIEKEIPREVKLECASLA